MPLFRSFSGPPQNNPRHSNPAYPRSNPSTPLSSRDYGEARRPAYDRRRAPQHSYSDGYEGYRSQYNSGRFQGNGPSASSYSTYSPGGSGSYQSQYSRGSHQFSPRDQSQRQQQRQQPHRNQGPPTRVSFIFFCRGEGGGVYFFLGRVHFVENEKTQFNFSRLRDVKIFYLFFLYELNLPLSH